MNDAFKAHMLTNEGKEKAKRIAESFDYLLEQLSEHCPAGRELAIVTTKLHPANVRAFTYDSSATASVAELTALFNQGFDVVSANATANNSSARVAINNGRGVSPP